MIVGARGIIPVPWHSFDFQYKVLLTPISIADGVNEFPAIQVPISRLLATQITGPSTGIELAVNGVIEQSPDGVDGWETIYDFPLDTGMNNLSFALVQRTQPFLRYRVTTLNVISIPIACVVAYELTHGVSGHKVHPLIRYDVRPIALRYPIKLTTGNDQAGPAVKLPAPGKIQVIQLNTNTGTGYSHNRIEESPNGIDNWSTIHTFSTMSGFSSQTALVTTTKEFVRNIITIDAIAAKAAPPPPPPTIVTTAAILFI